ncbi:hypothetical protein VV01_22030 [Luteipulveratus halotolerans]|uniref:Uncharacterized protein n=1 Tax=Luteipulveratus halotolerans TaxID=1631356 RepID=A0A0L6CE14_9MICO|nr:hypothetical protein VV01_21355 [Luteipulveratus halotolerans]KNX35935.1 hypothetical protein VV01_22030 [Luteipulveratus halotolerans]
MQAYISSGTGGELRSSAEVIGNAQKPLVCGALTGPALAELGTVLSLAHRLKPLHGDAVHGARIRFGGQSGPQVAGHLNDFTPGPQHSGSIVTLGIHEQLPGL